MDDTTLSIAALTKERDEMTRALQSLDVQREALQGKIEAIGAILSGFQRYAGATKPARQYTNVTHADAEAGVRVGFDADEDTRAEPEGGATVGAESRGPLPMEQTGKKRIRSTDMVAQMITESAHSWSREQVYEGFRDRYGIPPAWGNVQNALNNALGRAVERGLIRQDGEMFSPGDGIRPW